MLGISSDYHVGYRVSDEAVASNEQATELAAKLEKLAQSSDQHGVGAKVQSARSSQEHWTSPPASPQRGFLSKLCFSLLCIRPLPESRASSPLPPQSVLDHALVESANQAETDSINVVPQPASSSRMDKEITVDWALKVGYCKSGVVPNSRLYVYGRQYRSQPYTHFQRLSEFDQLQRTVLPFYHERLSHQWHTGMFHTIPVFSKKECAFIGKAKIAYNDKLSYAAVGNAFPKRYGTAKIHYVICPDGQVVTPSPLRVIELYGELVPVRTLNNGRYEVYRRDKLTATLAVEWDGQRWISARHEASRLGKRLVKALNRRSDIRQHDLFAQGTFSMNEKGIYLHQKSGKCYIKSGGALFLLEPVAHSGKKYRIQYGQKQLQVAFTKGKLRLM